MTNPTTAIIMHPIQAIWITKDTSAVLNGHQEGVLTNGCFDKRCFDMGGVTPPLDVPVDTLDDDEES
jgi:hypothetical protein